MLPTGQVAIGLGGNLGDAVATLCAALPELHAQVPLHAVSALYQSAPVGPPDQPWYANAVVLGRWSGAPEALLDVLQAIEHRFGRVRTTRWGARTLDLDLLWFGSEVIETPRLRVPHPEMAHRAFVLTPLADVLNSPIDRAHSAADSSTLIRCDDPTWAHLRQHFTERPCPPSPYAP